MNCEEAAHFFDAYLDKELSPGDAGALEDHVSKCRACLGHLEFDKALRQLLKKAGLNNELSHQMKAMIRRGLAV